MEINYILVVLVMALLVFEVFNIFNIGKAHNVSVYKAKSPNLEFQNMHKFINNAVRRQLLYEGYFHNETFIPNINLPELMNLEARLIDNYFDERYNIGYYFDMQASKATATSWKLVLSELPFKKNDAFKRRIADIERLLPELDLLLNTNRIRQGIDCKCNIALVNDGVIYFTLDRPDKEVITYQKALENNMLSKGEIPIGVDEDLNFLNVNIFDDQYFSWAIIASSRSGKTMLIHSILKTLTSKYNENDLELNIIDVAKDELVKYASERLVSTYISDISNVYNFLIELEGKLRLNNTNKKLVLFIDEFPKLFESETYSKEIINKLSSLASAYASKGFVLIVSTQQVRNKYFPGELLQNIKVKIVGSNNDFELCKKRLHISNRIDSVSGIGNFIYKDDCGVEKRFTSLYLD